jgi:hypothetical protein
MKEVKDYNPSKDPRLIDCKTECGNDKCYAKRYGLFAEKTCQNFVEAKLQTNADRIRAMSNEELASFLYVKTCEDGYPAFDTFGQWLGWLKQEAE